MKLSENTIAILENFVSINPSILFREGNVISTKSPLNTIAAIATVDESFDQKFAVYDLKKFLSVISLFDDPELELGEKQVVISSGKQRIKYTYAEPEAIVVGPEPSAVPTFSNPMLQFTFTPQMMDSVLKASAVLSNPEIAITGDGTTMKVRSFDKKDPTSDTYQVEVGETDSVFNIIFAKEYLKMIPMTYQVSVYKTPKAILAHFKADNISYYVPVDSESKFN